MKKIIKFKYKPGIVFVNIKTLHYIACDLYINPEYKNDWVQIAEEKLKQFIAEQKAQIQNTAVDAE